MINLPQLLEEDPIAKKWSTEVRQLYVDFYNQLALDEPLTIKIGKGGLSFYKSVDDKSVFVCHFNATPRKGQTDIGFADFRFDGLRNYIDIDTTIEAMRQAASAEIEIKPHKLWCSLHFPMSLYNEVADLSREHIIAKVQ